MVSQQSVLIRDASQAGADAREGAQPAEPLLISVVIPTLNRPAPLRRALLSAVKQTLPQNVRHEIVIIDNSPDANAQTLIAEIADACAEDFPHTEIRYVSEPHPGLANARNAGVAAAKGEWIAFLDDDQEAGPRWLDGFLIAIQRNRADALFGPVAVQPEVQGERLGVFRSLFYRQYEMMAGADLTEKCAYLGTNNSFFNVQRCFTRPQPFSVRLNTCGGEDSLLLRQLETDGRRFAWAADAKVTEFVPSPRLTWRYYRKRRFLSGQIRTMVFSMLDKPRWTQVALWMGIGAAQFVVYGFGALGYALFSTETALELQAAAMGGLGKVLWMKPFREPLYGARRVS